MVFHITFLLALFDNRKCCNYINLFLCILWDLFVMGLVLIWQRLLKTVDFVTCLLLTRKWSTCERSCERHMLEAK